MFLLPSLHQSASPQVKSHVVEVKDVNLPPWEVRVGSPSSEHAGECGDDPSFEDGVVQPVFSWRYFGLLWFNIMSRGVVDFVEIWTPCPTMWDTSLLSSLGFYCNDELCMHLLNKVIPLLEQDQFSLVVDDKRFIRNHFFHLASVSVVKFVTLFTFLILFASLFAERMP